MVERQYTLQDLIAKLDLLSIKVEESLTFSNTLGTQLGSQYPFVTGADLACLASMLSSKLNQYKEIELDEDDLIILGMFVDRIDDFLVYGLSNLFSGSYPTVCLSNVSLIYTIEAHVNSIYDWSKLKNTDLVPKDLSRKLRYYQSELSKAAPEVENLIHKISTITHAYEAAENLPATLDDLKDAKAKIASLTDEALVLNEKIKTYELQVSKAVVHTLNYEKESQRIVDACQQAYRIASTVGLSAAFSKRAQDISLSIVGWVVGLMLALGGASFFRI